MNVSRETVPYLALLICIVIALTGVAHPAPTYSPLPGCPAEPLAVADDLARRQPNEARYPVCVDQRALFERALEQARRDDRPLLVVIGAPWCPQCRVVSRLLGDGSAAGGADGLLPVSRDVVQVALSHSVVTSGKRLDVPATHALIDEITARSAATVDPLRAIPYFLVLDPRSGRVVGRNLAELQPPGSGAIDATGLDRGLAQAVRHVLHGEPAPPSASWLARAARKLGW